MSVEPYWAVSDLEAVQSCAVCGSFELSNRYSRLVDHEEGVPGTWAMDSCDSCSSLVLNPRPAAHALFKAYASYYTHRTPTLENAVLSQQSMSASLVRAYLARRFGLAVERSLASDLLVRAIWPLRQQLDYFMRHLPKPGGALLDVGCGSGGFLLRARLAGWTVAGIEPDLEALSTARSVIDCELATEFSQWMDGNFDFVSLSHVIEHLYSPQETLSQCFAALRPGGTLWIATPNIRSLGHAIYREHWQALETPRHLLMPSSKALEKMLRSSGFESISFKRRGRGALKRLKASHSIAEVAGARHASPRPLAMSVDLLASLSRFMAEELVVTARRPL